MKKNNSYLRLFFTYFFLTTPFLVAIVLVSLPETITVKPVLSMRIFFAIIALGLGWILFSIVENQYKNYKFKISLLILSIVLSTVFSMLFLSY